MGALVRLLDSAGADLGSYRVASIGAEGRALLLDAGGVTGAASFAGFYRFDTIQQRNGSTFVANDPVEGTVLP